MQFEATSSAEITSAPDEKHIDVAPIAEAKTVDEHFSVGDIIRGTATQRITPFERKAALINE